MNMYVLTCSLELHKDLTSCQLSLRWQTKETLRKLSTHHNAAGKELQRRIAKIREEGKDPNVPQTPHVGRPLAKSDSQTVHGVNRGRLDSSSNTIDESFMLLNQQVS